MELQNLILETHYDLFCRQISELSDDYPNLEVKQNGGLKYLKGVLDIPNDCGQILGSFLIEIHFSHLFPYRFPLLFETGGDIKNTAEWHKYPNGQCCITVTPDEIVKCKYGISIKEFIKVYCISFFANHHHRLLKGVYKNGEYAHNHEGIKQFYQGLFKTENINTWFSYIHHVFIKKEFILGRNDLCICHSQLKYKNCHLKIFNEMADIGFQQIFNDIKLLK